MPASTTRTRTPSSARTTAGTLQTSGNTGQATRAFALPVTPAVTLPVPHSILRPPIRPPGMTRQAAATDHRPAQAEHGAASRHVGVKALRAMRPAGDPYAGRDERPRYVAD